MNTFVVRNVAQKALFEHEIKEQLSHGYWKNAQPAGHWQPWCEAAVVADPDQPVGRNFDVSRDQYDLTANEFLEQGRIVRRMITKVKVAMTLNQRLHSRFIQLYDVDGSWQGLPIGTGEPEDRIREWIASRGLKIEELEQIRQIVASQDYSEDELKTDLQELQAAMHMAIPKAPD